MKASKSGFCEYLSRKKSNARIEREALEGFVVEAFHRHKSRYGYRRINRELRKSGIAVSEKRVLRIMQKPGLAGKGATRKRRIRKKVEPGDPRSNLVERAFSVGERNRLWVGGIACMPAREGWLYLAAAIDAFSRKVAGRSMSERITEKVAIDAIGQAVGREGPPGDGGLVFHDDQGAQHASRSFQQCLDSHGMVRSVSRPGTPLDNAVAESFFKTLKRELAEERSHGTRGEAKRDIFTEIQINPLIEGDRIAIAAGLPVAGDTRLHQKALFLIIVVRRNFRRKCRTRAHNRDPFCQDEKTRLPAEMFRLDSRTICFLEFEPPNFCSLFRPSSTMNQLRKTASRSNSKSFHWGIFPMGRFFASASTHT